MAVNAAGPARATLTLPPGFPPGRYTVTTSYSDRVNGHSDFAASSGTGRGHIGRQAQKERTR